MADRNLTKAERRQATTGSKAQRKEAKLRRKQPDATVPAGDGIESRLARLEQAVAAQSELSERMLDKLDEVLRGSRRSTRRKKAAPVAPAAAQEGEEGTSGDNGADESASASP
jgi:hypothetical protein